MGTTATSCRECFGTKSKDALSARSSLNYQYKRRKEKTREPSDEDLDKQEIPFVNEVYSADHAADRKDTEEERHQTTSIDDFRIVKLLGEGSFGKVYLVQSKLNKKFYALKAMKKQDLILKNLLKQVLTEKNILKELRHPYVVHLKYCFQSDSRVYMVMDYCPGGDLSHWMKKEGKFDEDIVKLYAAEMVLALQYLHEILNVIHRDIKPENILITADGHIKITDFGLAKSTTRAMTVCGTPDFLAPEIILGKPYGQEVDWWSLGCVMYEMLTGHATFSYGDVEKLIFSIVKEQPKMEDSFSEDLKDLLTKLLIKYPKKRLGYKGAEEVKKHPFFKDIDWEALLNKEIPPPFGKAALKYSLDFNKIEEDKHGSIFEIPPEESATKDPRSDVYYYSQFSYVAKDGAEIPSDIYTK